MLSEQNTEQKKNDVMLPTKHRIRFQAITLMHVGLWTGPLSKLIYVSTTIRSIFFKKTDFALISRPHQSGRSLRHSMSIFFLTSENELLWHSWNDVGQKNTWNCIIWLVLFCLRTAYKEWDLVYLLSVLYVVVIAGTRVRPLLLISLCFCVYRLRGLAPLWCVPSSLIGSSTVSQTQRVVPPIVTSKY